MILKLRTFSCTPTLQRPTCPPNRYVLSTPAAMTAPSIRNLILLPSASTRYKCQFLPGSNVACAIGSQLRPRKASGDAVLHLVLFPPRLWYTTAGGHTRCNELT